MIGADIRLSLGFLASIFAVAVAHAGSGAAQALLDVEIGREGQVLMRQATPTHREAEATKKANLAEVRRGADKGSPRKHRVPDEAAEAFAAPRKIDDSWWGTPRMPAFIEKNPQFYSALFVGGALAFMALVCLYVYYEDQVDESKRRRMALAAARRRLGNAVTNPPPAPRTSPFSRQPSAAAVRAVAEAAVAAVRAEQSQEERWEAAVPAPAPKARAARAAENGMHMITSAVGNITGILAGEKIPKMNSSRPSTETTASGASTPLSSLASRTGISAIERLSYSDIRSGTVLRAKVPEVIFASSTSWQEIGELIAGQQVIAAGPPEIADDYMMVPIKPRGAVDLKVLEVVWEY